MNSNTLAKVVLAVVAALCVIFQATIMSSDAKDGGMISPFIYLTYIVLVVAVVLVLFYTFKNISSQKPEALKRTFIGVGAFAAIVLVSFLFADSTPVALRDGGEVTAATSRWVSTGLNTFYILAFTAIGLMIFTGVKRIKG